MAIERTSPDLQPGAVLGHFEIVESIGAGGMGTVFRAHDLRLGRDVALKVLSAKLFEDDAARRRFLREARLAAAMIHPNIATVHEVDEQNGTLFIAMELVRGRDLKSYLADKGALSIEEIVSLGRQACEALEAAHEAGIIHRDIKPANIMLTPSGGVKLLDFGLAKPFLDADPSSTDSPTLLRLSPSSGPSDASEEPAPGISRAGVALGTPSYMAPEQAAGRDIDHRADLFSLGVVLYETATGGLPFRARTDRDLLDAIRFRQPPAVTDVRPETPEELSRVIEKCLAKAPQDRFPSAGALRSALDSFAETRLSKPVASRARAGFGASGSKRALAFALLALSAGASLFYWARSEDSSGFHLGERRRILVASFENRAGDADFDETLAVVLSAQLDQSSGFVVLPSESVRAVLEDMGLESDSVLDLDLAREVALRAEVPALVTGSVTRLGAEYVLHATLWSVSEKEPVRAFEERAAGKEQVLAAIDRMSAAIRRTLGETPLGTPEAPQALWTSSSWEALNLYAEALRRDDEDDVTGSIALLERAVEIDPGFAMAHAQLGRIYDALGNRPKSLRALQKAMATVERLTPKERGFVQAFYYQTTDQHEEMLAAAQPMASLFPEDPNVQRSLGHAFINIEDYAMAAVTLQRAIELAPRAPDLAYNLTNTYLLAGDYDRAREELARLEWIAPESRFLDFSRGYLSLLEGDVPGAVQHFQRYVSTPDPSRKSRGYYHWVHAYLLAGEFRKAAELLNERIAFSRSRKLPAIEAESLVLLARIDLDLGGIERIESRLANALALPLANAELQLAGSVAARAGELDVARSVLKRLHEEDPDSLQNERLVEELRGEIALAEGNLDEAIDILRDAAALTATPSWSEPLARALHTSGELDASLAEYLRIVSKKGPVILQHIWGAPRYAEALLRVAELHEALGSAAEAGRYYDEYSKLRPSADPELAREGWVVRKKVNNGKAR